MLNIQYANLKNLKQYMFDKSTDDNYIVLRKISEIFPYIIYFDNIASYYISELYFSHYTVNKNCTITNENSINIVDVVSLYKKYKYTQLTNYISKTYAPIKNSYNIFDYFVNTDYHSLIVSPQIYNNIFNSAFDILFFILVYNYCKFSYSSYYTSLTTQYLRSITVDLAENISTIFNDNFTVYFDNINEEIPVSYRNKDIYKDLLNYIKSRLYSYLFTSVNDLAYIEIMPVYIAAFKNMQIITSDALTQYVDEFKIHVNDKLDEINNIAKSRYQIKDRALQLKFVYYNIKSLFNNYISSNSSVSIYNATYEINNQLFEDKLNNLLAPKLLPYRIKAFLFNALLRCTTDYYKNNNITVSDYTIDNLQFGYIYTVAIDILQQVIKNNDFNITLPNHENYNQLVLQNIPSLIDAYSEILRSVFVDFYIAKFLYT